MKNVILLVLVFICISAKSQNKLDNTIVIDTTRTIKEIKKILFDNGFTIDGTDTSFFTTTAKQVNNVAVIKLMIARFDSSITIKGQSKLLIETSLFGSTIKNDFEPIFWAKSKSSLAHKWFSEMDKVAKLLGSKIHYLKQ
jgi:hypothetical protein